MALKAKLYFDVQNEPQEWYKHQKHPENESNNWHPTIFSTNTSGYDVYSTYNLQFQA